MKTTLRLTVAAFGLATFNVSAATLYVSLESPNPSPPFATWETAATNIQQAVDAALAGDEIVVTNGIYAAGGRAVGTNLLVNRVAVDKPLTLRSVNGPQFTVIQGYQVPGTTNGDGAIRCVYLTNGASLSGFTLTNGATQTNGDYYADQRHGGGLLCESLNAVVSNCVVVGNSANIYGGGAYRGTLNNCSLKGNSATYGGGVSDATLNNCSLTGNSASDDGGGAYRGTLNDCLLSGNWAYSYGGGYYAGSPLNNALNNCTLTGNQAISGGGAYGGTLNNCALTANSASQNGGGAYGANGRLNNCTLTGNTARLGGGAYNARLNNCTLTGNSASGYGGGAYGSGASSSTLNNCTLTGNSASQWGGGASGGTLNNCTLTGNRATIGGGAMSATLRNCIIYYNTASSGPNGGGTLNYCCTTPLPSSGVGNITAEPQLATASHLSANSPCRGAGSVTYATGLDIDGETWLNPPAIGCDEYQAGAFTGDLTVAIGVPWTNVVMGVALDFTGLINGRVATSAWDFGDGSSLSNRPYASHAWSAVGDYTVVLRAYNDSHPEGVSATVTVRVVAQLLYYVSAASANPMPPYSSWATAAQTIQEAVDVAAPGGQVVVTNGVYATGGRTVWEPLTNRVAVDKPLVIRSINGPAVTVIQGYQTAGTTNGDSAIRCVSLADGAVLNGFTLTNGATRLSTGVLGPEHNGGGVWCQSTNTLVTNCTLTANSAFWEGGGAYSGTLNNCTLIGNSATEKTLGDGGGASSSTLNNCNLSGNTAAGDGGGALGGKLNNCTLTGNLAFRGGGASGGVLNNCILYYNTANSYPNYYYYNNGTNLSYCCTTPLPSGGVGNFSSEPQLASTSHLSASSPCRGAGRAVYATGLDIDGEPWLNPPSIGCDEYQAGALIGNLTVAIGVSWTNVAVGFAVDFTAWISGQVAASAWDFGDGTILTNRPYATHAWAAAGDYSVVLRAYNDSHSAGISTTVLVHVVTQPVHYVAPDSVAPQSPYDSWGKAARNIQAAVDAALVPGALVLVTNGVYASGGRAVYGTMTNRVAVDKPLVVRSVNGPSVTVIQAYREGQMRCAYLVNGAVLSGFTLTNGATHNSGNDQDNSGGGVWCESTSALVSNCILTGNSAYYSGGGAYLGTLNNCTVTGNSAQWGGGVRDGVLNNCTLRDNSAANSGGGAYFGTLNNCTLTGNSASTGGGVCWGTLNNSTLTGNSAGNGGGALNATLNNCIVHFNTTPSSTNNFYSGTLKYCCTTPLPPGPGNITNAPLFVDYAGGDLRLQSNSPCINAGFNAYAPGPTDLDSLPRIVSGTVDIGAYEFQGSGSTISYAWLQQFDLPTDGSADAADLDGDGHTTWQEWRCQTCPTNAMSSLRLLTPAPAGNNLTVTWQSVAGANYFLERSTNLSSPALFTLLASGIPGQSGTTTYTDPNALGAGPFFYRVGVIPGL